LSPIVQSFRLKERFVAIEFDCPDRAMTSDMKSNRLVANKLYGYESFFQSKALDYRGQELGTLKVNINQRSLLIVCFWMGPVMANVLTFVAYAYTGHDLEPATIFAALQLFNLLSTPMAVLPMAMVAVLDALVSSRRIRDILVRKTWRQGSPSIPRPPHPLTLEATSLSRQWILLTRKMTHRTKTRQQEQAHTKETGGSANPPSEGPHRGRGS